VRDMDSAGGGQQNDQSHLCNLCEKLDFDRIFKDEGSAQTPGPFEWDIETIRGQNTCPFCRLLLKTLSMSAAFQTVSEGRVRAVCHTLVHDTQRGVSCRQLWVEALGKDQQMGDNNVFSLFERYEFCITLKGEPGYSEDLALLRARQIDQHQIDVSLISKWLSLCEGNHGSSCLPIGQQREKPTTNFRVIDVERGCVVEAGPHCRYVVLSYVWGSFPQFKLLRENHLRMSKDGSVFALLAELPNTIRDAILLCQKLNEQFLWVDSLCIIQDSPEDKNSQIPDMSHVYSCAVFAIIGAAGNDCNAGLPGVSKREVLQYSEKIRNLELLTTRGSVLHLMSRSVWHTRGWTLQEKVLPNRLLVFTGSEVFFYCGVGFWREDMSLETPGNAILAYPDERNLLDSDIRVAFRTAQEPTVLFWDIYTPLVASYIDRDLSFESDAINAFSGITSMLQDLGPFCWGLPNRFFSIALMWQDAPLRRRTGFPSWSWAGWKHNPTRTETTVYYDWRGIDSIMPIYYHFHSNGDFTCFNAKSDLGALPKNRVRVKNIWSHLVPKGGSAEFFSSRVKHSALPIHHFVFFWTSSAFFRVDRQPSLRDDSEICNLSRYTVRGPDGTKFDMLWLDSEWRNKQPDKLEFILIAFDKRDKRVIDSGGYDDDSVIAMLIEWIDGIAYRVQLMPLPGSILLNIWIKAKPKRKLVILG
jgi:hypothetical protein